LLDKGLPAEAVEALQPILNLSGTNSEKLDQLAQVLATSETGLKGIEELRTIFALYAHSTQDGDLGTYEPAPLQIELDLCLARGLNYYTGAIFEVKALDAQIGSITGGGRYDNLTGIFGMPGVSGVGISFGADRIYDVLAELNLYPENLQSTTQLLFATFGQEELLYAVRWAGVLRDKGYSVEVYPEPTKMKKQMGYADAKKIPFVAIVGSDEMATGKVMLKNMTTGQQQLVNIDELLASL
jgi:histidyl-tRNA synthetase